MGIRVSDVYIEMYIRGYGVVVRGKLGVRCIDWERFIRCGFSGKREG